MMKQKRETRQQNIDSSSKWPQSKQETNMDLGNVTITFDIRHAGGIEQDAIVLPRVSFLEVDMNVEIMESERNIREWRTVIYRF